MLCGGAHIGIQCVYIRGPALSLSALFYSIFILVQVDNHDLCQLTPRDSVTRIKEKPVVTLTVLRATGASKHSKTDPPPHLYDEIDLLCSDQNQLSQHALSQPLPGLMYDMHDFPHLPALSQYDENHPPAIPPPLDFGKYSPSAQQRRQLLRVGDERLGQRHYSRAVSPGAHMPHRASSYGQGEHTSKDSGLSSGSSDSAAKTRLVGGPTTTGRLQVPLAPTLDLNRDVNVRKSYRTEQEMVRRFIKERRRNGPVPPSLATSRHPVKNQNCRIVGDYELEVMLSSLRIVCGTMWVCLLHTSASPFALSVG